MFRHHFEYRVIIVPTLVVISRFTIKRESASSHITHHWYLILFWFSFLAHVASAYRNNLELNLSLIWLQPLSGLLRSLHVEKGISSKLFKSLRDTQRLHRKLPPLWANFTKPQVFYLISISRLCR